MTQQSGPEILRRIAADLDRVGFLLAGKCRFDAAVRLFMKAEESRRIARIADQFGLLQRRRE